MEGVPGMSSLSRDHRPARLLTVAMTLASLHNALLNKTTQVGAERYRRMVLDPLATVARFAAEPSVLRGCAEIQGLISVEWIDSLPVIPQHGDLISSNLLGDGDRWYVVDWAETYGMVDFPFYDLLTLLLSLLTARGETIEHWNPGLANQIPNLIQRYAQEMRLPAGTSSLLLPLTLANLFHLQWRDGRHQFTDRMYKTILDYFKHRDQWQNVFAHL
jgi:hypothetical protein